MRDGDAVLLPLLNREVPMRSLRSTGPQFAVLWLLILGAWALALRRGSLVPWGSGEGPGQLGTPVWSVVP